MTEETNTAERPALPDHLSTDERSPHFVRAIFEHDIGIRFNDKERTTSPSTASAKAGSRYPSATR
jgi:hypothetical protein